MRTLDEAKSRYPQLVSKFIDIDLTSDKRYIYRMCEMFADKEGDEQTIKSVFSKRCEINELLSDDDVEGRNLTQLINDNAKGTFRSRWYWYKEAKDDWRKTIIYEDDNTTINKPSTFAESRNVGNPIWCFCKKEYKWDQHNFGEEPETIYFVHSLSVNTGLEYCAVCVRTNGDKLIIDGLHKYLSRQDGGHSEYLSSIGQKANAKLVSDKTPLLPSVTIQATDNNKTDNNKTDKNESKNMSKKNTIRLTESELKQIISESVKGILSELDWRTYSNAARKRFQQAGYGGNGRANNPEMVNKGNQLSKYANDMFQKQYGVSIYDVSNPNWRNSNPGHPAIKAWEQHMQGN